nr:molybdenum cofactor guanylyltransferase [Candidatus Sigynarchaeota archaeon]
MVSKTARKKTGDKSSTQVWDDITLVILAGGASRRFQGKQKALIDLGGTTVIESILNELGNSFKHIYISVKNDEQERALRAIKTSFNEKISYLKDLAQFPGGMRDDAAIFGIYSSLSEVSEPYAFVISCDMPFVTRDIVSLLAQHVSTHPDAIVPRWENGYLEPMLAIYQAAAARSIIEKHILQRQYQLIGIFKDLKNIVHVPIESIKEVDPNLSCVVNINTERDLEAAREIFKTRLKKATP